MKQGNCTLNNSLCTVDRLNNQPPEISDYLIQLIAANSDVPCFIRAPKKSGSNELIQAFIQTFGNDQGVSLVNASDDGLLELPTNSKLVIVPNLQWLEDQAAEQFSAAIDELIELDKQVIIACAVQNDRFENLQSDRLLIDGEMLLNHSWFKPSGYATSIAAFLADFLPLEIRLLAALTLILGKTDLNELNELGYSLNEDLPQLLCDLHPLFSFQESNGFISVCDIQLREASVEICQVFAEYLELGQNSLLKPECLEMLTKLSIHMLEKGNLKRSHQILEIIESLFTNSELNNSQNNQKRDLATATTANNQRIAVRNNLPEFIMDDTQASARPKLYIKLFGEMEFYLDGVELKSAYLQRNKIRRMILMMAVNHKKGASREVLVEYLWSYLDFEHALRNLYTSWSFLAKGLGSETIKDCHFLVRHGQLYKLNFDYVSCDIHIFEELAKQVLFENCSQQQIVDNIRCMESLYKNELISNSNADSFQKSCAVRFRALMVDAMMVAIKTLKANGDQAQALYFARSAHEIDTSREDIYRELMNVQLEAGQRTSAMQTYFSCKRYLSEELGILPSKKTTALYQELLMDRA